MPSVLFVGKVSAHQDFIQIEELGRGKERGALCRWTCPPTVGTEKDCTIRGPNCAPHFYLCSRRVGLAKANCHPQATCFPLNTREGNLFSAQQRKIASQMKLTRGHQCWPQPATRGETWTVLTHLLSGLLIRKTLNLEPICSFLAPFSCHPDPSLKKRALQTVDRGS